MATPPTPSGSKTIKLLNGTEVLVTVATDGTTDIAVTPKGEDTVALHLEAGHSAISANGDKTPLEKIAEKFKPEVKTLVQELQEDLRSMFHPNRYQGDERSDGQIGNSIAEDVKQIAKAAKPVNNR